jgi:hypothetical protein
MIESRPFASSTFDEALFAIATLAAPALLVSGCGMPIWFLLIHMYRLEACTHFCGAGNWKMRLLLRPVLATSQNGLHGYLHLRSGGSAI